MPNNSEKKLLAYLVIAVVAICIALPAFPVRAATLPFCTQHQLKVKAYEHGKCRIWMRNAIGGGQTYGRHGR
jgi:hypothetical protein